VLEIGCGMGQATLPFARRGYPILCVELGENLAAVARRNLSPYPRAEVLTADFEDVLLPGEAFNLAISATAFHWLGPAGAYQKVARALRPGGGHHPLLERARLQRRERGLLRGRPGGVRARDTGDREARRPQGAAPARGLAGQNRRDRGLRPLRWSDQARDYAWDEPYDAEDYCAS
jgi:SAM-dependent methyltransferase